MTSNSALPEMLVRVLGEGVPKCIPSDRIITRVLADVLGLQTFHPPKLHGARELYFKIEAVAPDGTHETYGATASWDDYSETWILNSWERIE